MTTKFQSCGRYFSRLGISLTWMLLVASIPHAVTSKEPFNIDGDAVFFGNATALAQSMEKHICEDGLILFLWRPAPSTSLTDNILKGVVYICAMCYLFVGIALVSDRFLASIEVITSKEKESKVSTGKDTYLLTRRVCNAAVANFALISLGSSAPEILLAVIEVVGQNFQAGNLGPGTILGAAAFNMLITVAICIAAVPADKVRRIHQYRVFLVTAPCSIFAYVWIYVIMKLVSPGVIDVWEAVVTLLCFPIVTLLVYMADRRFLCFGCGHKTDSRDTELGPRLREELDDFQSTRLQYVELLKELRKKYPKIDLKELERVAQEFFISRAAKSHHFYRIQAIRKLVGNNNISRKISDRAEHDLIEVAAEVDGVNYEIEEESADLRVYFQPEQYTVKESCGDVEIRVVRRGDVSVTTVVSFYTVDGTADAGSDYVAKSGTLKFAPGVEEQSIKITVIDDDMYEQDEYFYVYLSDVSAPATIALPDRATVFILDDDHSGIFTLEQKDGEVAETAGTCDIKVLRSSGARGRVVVPYWTEDDTAMAGIDYEETSGELLFEDNETEKVIKVNIIEQGSYEKDVMFYMNIGDPQMAPEDRLSELINSAELKSLDRRTPEDNMVLLGRPKLGAVPRLPVQITESADFKSTVDKLVKKANATFLFGPTSWKEQFMETLTVNPVASVDVEGDAFEEEEWKTPTCRDYIMQFVTLFWRILFAFIPPTDMYNGYLCFLVSLIIMGVIMTVIYDVASHFSCTLGIHDTVTAITLLAIGATIPDAFASRYAAIQDKAADNSIGIIPRRNAVSAFLGIGIAWTVGALYHTIKGTHFKVQPVNFGFSLIIFVAAAVLVFVVLLFRRAAIGGELGGPSFTKILSSLLFYLLWFALVSVTTLELYTIISGF